jgi:hypothetical protein
MISEKAYNYCISGSPKFYYHSVEENAGTYDCSGHADILWAPLKGCNGTDCDPWAV